jgi:hypothetical protein
MTHRKPATGPYPEPDESSPHPDALLLYDSKVAPRHEGVWGSGGTDPRILDLGTT